MVHIATQKGAPDVVQIPLRLNLMNVNCAGVVMPVNYDSKIVGLVDEYVPLAQVTMIYM